MRAYHVTPTQNVESILQSGLVPQVGDRGERFRETAPLVFFIPDLKTTFYEINDWLLDEIKMDTGNSDITILEVDLLGYDIGGTSRVNGVVNFQREVAVSDHVGADRIISVMTMRDLAERLWRERSFKPSDTYLSLLGNEHLREIYDRSFEHPTRVFGVPF